MTRKKTTKSVKQLLLDNELLRRAKFNRYSLSDEETEALYARITQSIHKRKTSAGRKKIVYAAAACAAILCAVGLHILFSPETPPEIRKQTVAADMPVDNSQTEVELELRNNEKIIIADKANIRLNPAGVIQIPDKQKISSSTASADPKGNVPDEKRMNLLKVPHGRSSFITLADGTKVWVNSGTVLHFPSTFDKDNRTIYASGEIYLEVAKDASRPFRVETSQMNIQVSGTSFNVTAYNDEPIHRVVLVEGSVKVDNSAGQTYRMQPNEKLELLDNQMVASHVKTDYYTSWKDGVLLLEKEPLSSVVKRLERYYKLHFEYSEEIANYKYSGKLVLFDDITRVMKTLKESASISFQINGDKIILSTKPAKATAYD